MENGWNVPSAAFTRFTATPVKTGAVAHGVPAPSRVSMSLAFVGTTGEGEAGGKFTTFTFGVPLMPTLPDTGCVAGKLPTFTVPLTVWVDGKLLTETGGRLLTPTVPLTPTLPVTA